MTTKSNYEIAEPGALYFYPDITQGWVCKVYDGDTITVVAQLPEALCGCHDKKKCPARKFYKFHLRILGVDTPEIKSKNADEVALAIKARDALSKLILHKVVDLAVTGQDKYGRLLAQVRLDKLDVNDWILQNKYGIKYDGGTKKTFTDFVNWYEL